MPDVRPPSTVTPPMPHQPVAHLAPTPERPDALAVSPTGKPLLPPRAVPWIVGGLLVLEGLAHLLPGHTIGAEVVTGVARVAETLAIALGLISAGWRKTGA